MRNIKPSSVSSLAICFIAIVFCFVSIYHQYFDLASANVITWDVFGYYSWLIGIFGKTGHFNLEEIRHLYQLYPISGGDLYQVMPMESGKFVPIYTMGLAILYLPFFLIAHLFTSLFLSYSNDGLSAPYQWGIIVASIFYAVLGFYWLRKVLLNYFSDKITAITLLVVALGTNYFYYICYENGMPHAYLFSLYAGLLWYSIKWHEIPRTKYIVYIALLIAILALARPSECIAVLIPLLYGIYDKKPLTEKVRLLRQNGLKICIAFLPALYLLFMQMLLWKILLNKWWFNAYAAYGHSFDLLKPHLIDGLFSYRKGWLVYTPIMLLALGGFIQLRKRIGNLFLPILFFTLVNIYIVLSWHIWWYANSFGLRALVQSYSLLAVPLACAISWLSTKKHRFAGYGLISLLVLLNLFQTWQYNHKILPKDNNNSIYYWMSFGKTSIDKDAKKYLETKEHLRDVSNKNLQALRSLDYNTSELDSIRFLLNWKGEHCEVVDKKKEYSQSLSMILTDEDVLKLKTKWLLVQSRLAYSGTLFNDYNGAKLVFSLDRKDKNIKWIGAFFQKYRDEKEMTNFSYETQLPLDIEAGDKINILIWNTSPDTIYLNSLKLSLIGN